MQSRDNDPYNRTQAPSTTSERDQTVDSFGAAIESSAPREGFLTGSFVWMFVGVLLSGVAAYAVATNEQLLQTVSDYWLLLLIGQLILVFGIMFAIARIPSIVAP